MAKTVLTPCPTCGKRFDFPLTGCITGVAELLLANSKGMCPDCGALVVVDRPVARPNCNPLSAATTPDAIGRIPIVDLPLSIRCRLALIRMKAKTVGELLQHGRQAVLRHLGESSSCSAELGELFDKYHVDW